MLNDREKLIELLGDVAIKSKDLCLSYGDWGCGDCPYQKDDAKGCRYAIMADLLIANGVTVQKKGKWIDHACSCCGKVNPTLDMNDWGDYVSENTNYCGNCGADMRGDKSEND